jgi:hypothetical protein
LTNDFKFPQVWRTSLGLDHKFKGDYILTLDMSYNKDLKRCNVSGLGIENN